MTTHVITYLQLVAVGDKPQLPVVYAETTLVAVSTGTQLPPDDVIICENRRIARPPERVVAFSRHFHAWTTTASNLQTCVFLC